MPSIPAPYRHFAANIAVFLIYFLAGKIGLMYAFLHPSATPVWAPTGVSIAALLIAGWGCLPAIFAGAMLVNYSTAGTVLSSIAIASGNTLEALFAAWLIRRYARGVHTLECPRDIFIFITAVFAGSVLSATVGTLTLFLTGLAQPGHLTPIWLTWWLGNVSGGILVAPLLMLWLGPREPEIPRQRSAEGIAMLISLAIVTEIAFNEVLWSEPRHLPLSFMGMLFLMWGALRFGPRTAITTNGIFALLVLDATFRGRGPFAILTPNDALLLMQCYLGSLTVTGLLVASAVVERRRAEAERNDLFERERTARNDAEYANRMKDEFFATLSHELRTPLNAILGWASLMRRGKIDPEHMETALDTVERNARSQAAIISDLLDMNRIISGKLRLELGPVSVPGLVERCIESVKPTANARNVALTCECSGDIPEIEADANRVQQIVLNLLSNAIKFTPPHGSVVVKVSESTAAGVEIQVADTGIGIEPSFLPHVFDRFRQANASITRSHGGLGLGLSIVKHLVERHGGTIRAESVGKDRGATFVVTLPRTVIDSAVHRNGTVSHRSGTKAAVPDFPPGFKVLVVDDENDARELVKHILEDRKITVRTAASVDEALKALDDFKPQLLISDIGMPGQDGYSLIRAIRGREHPIREIKAIALTAFAGDAHRQRAIEQGYQRHITKPIEPHELIATVAGLVADR